MTPRDVSAATAIEAADRPIVAETMLGLVLELSRARRQRDAWCSLALKALDLLAEARRDRLMCDPALAERFARDATDIRRDVSASYDGARVVRWREPERAA